MIASEMVNNQTVVRIHDEFLEKDPQECLARANRIVSGSYKRRALKQGSSTLAGS